MTTPVRLQAEEKKSRPGSRSKKKRKQVVIGEGVNAQYGGREKRHMTHKKPFHEWRVKKKKKRKKKKTRGERENPAWVAAVGKRERVFWQFDNKGWGEPVPHQDRTISVQEKKHNQWCDIGQKPEVPRGESLNKKTQHRSTR